MKSKPPLYPLTFYPIFKEKIWGGQKLKTILGKEIGDIKNCGESWEISAVEGDVSVVKNGHLKGKKLTEVIEEYGEELLGKKVVEKYGKTFPLLIKFIDAQEDLSVQVHPNDELAQKRHGCLGKTEMWYVIQADENASLIAGFSEKLDKEKYLNALKSGQLMNVLKKHSVSAGDAFYIPAGRVHTIGKGILLAEVQQSSDITYRIYDFDRVDSKGNKRELHTELALEALDFEENKPIKINKENKIHLQNQYFEIEYKTLKEREFIEMNNQESFSILMVLEGEGYLKTKNFEEKIQKGESWLMPLNFSYNLINSYHLTFLEINLNLK
jgi:mannose-6-phosphate isomerase